MCLLGAAAAGKTLKSVLTAAALRERRAVF